MQKSPDPLTRKGSEIGGGVVSGSRNYAYLSPQAMLEAVNVVGNVVRRRAGVNQGAAATV